MVRALLFAGTSVAWFAFWFLRGFDQTTTSMQEWPNVIAFSAMLLTLALALAAFGQVVGGRSVMRWATIAAGAAGAMSVVNIVEDGFRVEAAFYAFVLGLLILDVSLGGLALATARAEAGRRRLLAAIPAATLAAILFPPAGGPLMLGAWLAASVAAWRVGTARGAATRP